MIASDSIAWRVFRLGATLAVLALAHPALAQVSSAMRTDIPDAVRGADLSAQVRADAVQAALGLATPPHLSAGVSLTPNQPYGQDGSALNFWKPSFVLATPEGGEAGVNFWGQHDEGHINVALTPDTSRNRVLDCRILSAAPIAFKIYSGPGSAPLQQGRIVLAGHHLFLATPPATLGQSVLVELWPTTPQAVGFFGCDVAELG